MTPLLPLVLAVAAALLPTTLAQTPGVGHFFFNWPQTTSQCEVVNITWNNATPPFSTWILPMGSQPFLYNIPESAYDSNTGAGSYQVQLQLNSGTNYIVLMSDAFGLGSGGTAEVQQVASSQRTACLNTASKNQTASQFSFAVSGQAKQCQTGFTISWSAVSADEPYNYTVLPLDQGFFPFEVPLRTDQSWDNDYKLNLTAGTRFTIVLNNKNGRGTGGVGGIYQVANSSASACVTGEMDPTGSWPVGIATNTLPVATVPTSTSTSSSLGGGAIAGVVIGVLALLGIIAPILFFLLRRRRRRNTGALAKEKAANGSSGVDLAEGEGPYTEYENPGPAPVLEPYRPVGSFPPPEGYEGPEGHGHDNERDSATTTSAGFAGLGAGQGRSSWIVHNADGLAGDGEERVGPGTAGPLPLKTPRGANASRNPAHPPRISTVSTTPSSGKAGQAAGPGAGAGLGVGATAGPGMGGGMRIANPDANSNPDEGSQSSRRGSANLPPPGSAGLRRAGEGYPGDDSPRRTQFRRHEDAGRVDVVDLPPLYTDVPRDGALRLDGAPGDAEASPVPSPGARSSPVPSASPAGAGASAARSSPDGTRA